MNCCKENFREIRRMKKYVKIIQEQYQSYTKKEIKVLMNLKYEQIWHQLKKNSTVLQEKLMMFKKDNGILLI